MATRPARPAAGTPEAKARRAAQPDLSRLTETQRTDLALLITFAEAAFGTKWSTALAQALGEHRGTPVAPDQVASWASGRRPVPKAVIDDVFAMRERIAADLRARAQIVIDWPMKYGDPDAPLSPSKDALTAIDAAARPLTPQEAVAEIYDDDGQG